MAVSFNDLPHNESQKNEPTKNRANGATYIIHTDKHGQYFHHPQRGRVKVVALHCDCGRSILVSPKELKKLPILCSHCNSAFRWQQLVLDLD